MTSPQWPESPFLWWVVTANFLSMKAIVAVALGAIVRFPERALERQRGARSALFFLAKPFSANALAAKLREALET
jgi:hypothetical protein